VYKKTPGRIEKNAGTIERVERSSALSGAIDSSNQTDRFSGYAELECYLAICVDTENNSFGLWEENRNME